MWYIFSPNQIGQIKLFSAILLIENFQRAIKSLVIYEIDFALHARSFNIIFFLV